MVLADPNAAAAKIVDRMSAGDLPVLQQTLDALPPALSEYGCFDAAVGRSTLAGTTRSRPPRARVTPRRRALDERVQRLPTGRKGHL
jgi:hypothetical protein